MKFYIGFDDTDNIDADRGTGKLARWFEKELPDSCHLEGVLRQQLLIHEDIPYTSHNSAACVVVRAPDPSFAEDLTDRAVKHIERYKLEGSDPGVCVAGNGNGSQRLGSLQRLMEFGRECTVKVVTQQAAMRAASGFHLSGHGGTEDGIIGAAAAVGLTASGWNGRFIEFGRLRKFPEVVRVSDMERAQIRVVSIDRNANVPAPDDLIHTGGWLRPRLLGNRAALIVDRRGDGSWESVGRKRGKGNGHPSPSNLL